MTDETPASAGAEAVVEQAPAKIARSVNEVVDEAFPDKADDAPKAEVDEFPKKAVNAINYRDQKISKRDKEIGSLRAESSYQQKEIEKLNSEIAKLRTTAPKPEDFKEWGELNRAQTEHTVDLRTAEKEKANLEQRAHSLSFQVLPEILFLLFLDSKLRVFSHAPL